MMEIDPENESAWYALSEIKILLLKSQYEELNDIIAQGFDHASSKTGYVEWMKNLYNEANLNIDFPFAPDYNTAEEINAVGNTSENLISVVWGPEWADYRGMFASQGGWIYFADPDDGFALYKKQISSDGNRTRLCEDVANYINVIGDWIYYVNVGDKNALYKIRTDGEMKTKLSDDACGAVAAKGDWIYFNNQNEEGSIYKIRTDGSERQFFSSGGNTMFIEGDWLYFSAKDERNSYRIPLEGGEAEQLLKKEWHVNMAASGGWLYYISDSNGLCIKKMKTDGSETKQIWLYDSKINGFAVVGSRIVVSVYDRSKDNLFLCLTPAPCNSFYSPKRSLQTLFVRMPKVMCTYPTL
jgi:hypothetical protein